MGTTGGSEPLNVLYRIKRGLSGYISYLAACEMNQAFSEYVLYEPILRILTARGYSVSSEFPCPGLERQGGGRGDQKKIDFDATGHNCRFAIEVKWARNHRVDVHTDHEKLSAYRTHFAGSRSFLCVFGRRSKIENIVLRNGSFVEIGMPVYADFGVTKYGCRMYELTPANQPR
jgi:hypothetical protein